MSRWYRSFPGHPTLSQRQILAVTVAAAAVTPMAPHVVTAAQQAWREQDRARQSHVIAPRPAALANHSILAAGQPRTVTVVDQSGFQPRRSQHGSRLITIRSSALTNHAILAAGLPHTVSIVDTATPRQRRRSQVLEPRPAGLTFTPAAAATPPATTHVIQAAQASRLRRSARIITARTITTPAAPTVTPLHTTHVVKTAPTAQRQRRVSDVIAARPQALIFTPAPAVTPPQTTHVILAHVEAHRRHTETSLILGTWPRAVFGPARVASPPRTRRTASVGLPETTAVRPAAKPTRAAGSSGVTIATGMTGKTRVHQKRFSRTRVCTLGYSNQSGTTDIPTLETSLGRQFHGLRQNQQITTTSWSFAISDYDAGRGPATYRSIQLNTGLYTDITAGTWDANLTTIGQGLIAANRWTPGRAILTFMHEVTLSSNDFLGTKQDYINAFRHIRDLFDSLHVTEFDKHGNYLGGPAVMARVAFEREFTNGAETPPAGKAFADYDPDLGTSPAPTGTSYYELVGSDPYNNIVSGSLKYGTNAATLLDGPRNAAIARGKEWMIGELGCQDGATTQSHQDKAAWLDSVRQYIVALGSKGPGVCRYMFTTQETGSLYNWDSSAEALAAGQRIAASTYFA